MINTTGINLINKTIIKPNKESVSDKRQNKKFLKKSKKVQLAPNTQLQHLEYIKHLHHTEQNSKIPKLNN